MEASMLKHLITCLAGIGALLLTLHAAAAEKRVALVIGNSAYQHTAPLRNPSNDATDMAAKLRELGFDVIDGIDLTKAEMESRIRAFADKLVGSDVGLFYYAGHGLAVDGKNFLAPVDAALKSEADVDFETVELNLVLKQMERNSRLSLVFLDACRNNPLATNLATSSRSLAVSHGLARVEKAVGMMIAFSTRPEDVALDGEGRNSPFTGALLRHISDEGESVNDVMIEVRNDVLKATDGKQVPWENSSLTGQFFFKPAAPKTAADDSAETSAQIAALQKEIARLQTDQGAVLQSQQEQLDLLKQKLAAETKGPAPSSAQADAATPPSDASQAKPTPDAQAPANRVIAVEPAAPGVAPAPAPNATKVATVEGAAPETETPPTATPPATPLPEGVSRAQLATDIVTALKSLDCYRGRISGTWGGRSQTALQRFNATAKLNLPLDEPAPETLDAIKGWTGAHCRIEQAVVPHVEPKARPRYKAQIQKQAPYRPRTAAEPPRPHGGHGSDELNELQRLFPQTYQPPH
jgi:uncharacterized caspase-like protein